MLKSQPRSFHPTGKFEHHIEQGSNALGTFFCIVLAAMVIYWLCQDTSAGLTNSIHHNYAWSHKEASTLSLILDWF